MQSAPSLDAVDQGLADRLVVDGRASNRSLAAELGVTEHTVAARLRRLEAERIVRVVAVTDIVAFGFDYYAFALIEIVGRPAGDVARELARLPNLISVNVTSGRFGIVARVMASDRRELARIVGEQIPAVPGVGDVSCEWAVEILRDTPRFASLADSPSDGPELPAAPGLDAVDVRLIELLRQDARTSNRRIAALLDVSEGTVRTRVRRLQDAGFVRFQAVCDHQAFGMSAAFVGVRATRGAVAEVVARLPGLPGVQFAVRTIGLFDFHLLVFAEPDRLATLLTDEIGQLAGVASVQALQIHSTVKHTYTWAQIR